MITRLYSVYDSVAGEYGPLFQAKNDDVAMRNVVQMFTEMHFDIMNLESYHLYYVGDFDSDSGAFVSVNPNEEIAIDFGALTNVFDAYKLYCDGLEKTKEDK